MVYVRLVSCIPCAAARSSSISLFWAFKISTFSDSSVGVGGSGGKRLRGCRGMWGGGGVGGEGGMKRGLGMVIRWVQMNTRGLKNNREWKHVSTYPSFRYVDILTKYVFAISHATFAIVMPSSSFHCLCRDDHVALFPIHFGWMLISDVFARFVREGRCFGFAVLLLPWTALVIRFGNVQILCVMWLLVHQKEQSIS